MTWQVSLALRGNLQAFLDAEVKGGKSAVTTVIRRRTNALRNNMRKQIADAGLGNRLGKTVKSLTYPERGASLNAAGIVFSKATYKRPRGIVDLITVFDQENLLSAKYGRKWIPIPNKAVTGEGTGVRGHPFSKSPSDPEFKDKLFFRKTSKANVAILALKSDPTKVAFWLVKIGRLHKRLDVNKLYMRAIRNIDEAVAKTWERNSNKARSRFNVDI